MLWTLVLLPVTTSAVYTNGDNRVISTVGLGKDFGTLKAWNDFAKSHTNPAQWAECYAGTNLGTFNATSWASTPTVTNYPRVYPAAGNRHNGKDEISGAYILLTNNSSAVTIWVPYFRLEGICLTSTGTVAKAIDVYRVAGSGPENLVIDGNLVRGPYSQEAIYVAAAGASALPTILRNNIIYGAGTNQTVRGIMLNDDGNTLSVYLYNNSVYNCGIGFNYYAAPPVDLTVYSQNNVAIGTLTNRAFYNNSDGISYIYQTNCVSGDSTADDWGGTGHRLNVSFSDCFVATNDLTPKVRGPLDDTGLTQTTFTNDALGRVRPQWAAWDVGAIERPNCSSWPYKMKITFTGYDQAGVLTNFPALVVLSNNMDNSGFNYSQFAATNGGDLRFANAAETTELNYEIDEWNTNGQSFVWTQVPLFTNNCYIWMYWGMTNATAPAYTTNGATWSNSYRGVWHMKETNDALLDSALIGSTNDCSHGEYSYGQVTNGVVGRANVYTQGYARVDIGNSSALASLSQATVSFLYYKFATPSQYYTLWGHASDYNYGIRHHSADPLHMRINTTVGVVTSTTLANLTWYHVAFELDDAADYAKAYVNGVLVASNTTTATWMNPSRLIGAVSSNPRGIDGIADEMRISDVVRSSNWLWTCWLNMASNDLTLTASPYIGPPTLTNNAATNITSSSAYMNGNLMSTGSAPTYVWLYWGLSDAQGTNSNWGNTNYLGMMVQGALSTNIGNLSAGTLYYYRFWASNSVGTAWASPTTNFSTLSSGSAPTLTNNAATNIMSGSAYMNGGLSSTGGLSTTVWLYWGTFDGQGTNNAWGNTNSLGVRSEGVLSTNISGLGSNTTYYYRYRASNSAGTAWATPTTNFTTLPPGTILILNGDEFTDGGWNNGLPAPGNNGTITNNGKCGNYEYGAPFNFNKNGATVTVSHTAGTITSDGFDWAAGNGGTAVYNWNQSGGLVSLQRLVAISTNINYTLSGTGWMNAYSQIGGAVETHGSGTFTQTGGLVTNLGYHVANGGTMSLSGGTGWNIGWARGQAYELGDSASGKIDISGNYSATIDASLVTPAMVVTFDVPGTGSLVFELTWTGSLTRDNSTKADWITALTDTGIMVGTTQVTSNNFDSLFVVQNAGAAGSSVRLGVVINNADGATNITSSSAYMNGNLLSTGGSPTYVWLYWGTFDGQNTNNNWGNTNYLGMRTVGALSTNIGGLGSNTTYWYRYYATNSSGSNWAIPSTNFTTLGVAPSLTNNAATNITSSSAYMNGGLSSTGGVTTYVWLYWGLSDAQGTNSNWGNTNYLGVRAVGALSTNIGNLSASTPYFYRYWASNSVGTAWASPSTNFTTLGTAPTLTNNTATGITLNSAYMNGGLVSTGGSPTYVWLYWGTFDGQGTNNNWGNTNYLGMRTVGALSTNIGGLLANTTYWYRYYATNSSGSNWAIPSTNVTTGRLFTNWLYKMKITFTGYDQAGVLTNFPALVVLSNNVDNSGFNYNQFGTTNSADLRFANAAETMELNYEMDTLNTNGQSFVWTQVPLFTNNCYIWAYWGMTNVTAPAYTTNGATWSEGYRAVWHMSQTNVQDSTSYRNDGEAQSAGVMLVWTGQIGRALSFGGTASDIIIVPDSDSLDVSNAATFEAWGYDTFGDANARAIFSKRVSATIERTYGMFLYSAHTLAFDIATNRSYSLQALRTSLWTQVVCTFDGSLPYETRKSCYVDGSLDSTNLSDYSTIPAHTTRLHIASLNVGVAFTWGGMLDELRISSVRRSSNWVWAGSRNMASNDLTVTASPYIGPPSLTNNAATNVTTTSAYMNGNLVATGTATTAVWLYWGTSDGQGTPTAWGNTNYLGVRTVGALSTNIGGLSSGTPYYYRFWASNTYGTVWATPSMVFTSVSGTAQDFGMYSDALGINLGTGDGGVADVSGMIATPQAPLAGGWTNAITGDDGGFGAWRTSGYGGGGWQSNATTIYTAMGAAQKVQNNEGSPFTNFYIQFYANWGNAEVGPMSFGGDANTLTNWGYRGKAQWNMSMSWENFTVFSNYDVYVYLGPNAGYWTNNSWNCVGTYTGNAYKTVVFTTFASWGTLDAYAIQFLSRDSVIINNAGGATNVGPTNAYLTGNLVSDGSASCAVRIYYGTNDGVTTFANWNTNVLVGTNVPTGGFMTNVTGLAPATLYYYRCYGTNITRHWAWATNSTTFLTAEANGTGNVWIVATDPTAKEAGLDPGTFTISRPNTAISTNGPLNINYTISGNAGNGTDYVQIASSLTLAAGMYSTNITITPIADNITTEGSETVTVTLAVGPYVILGSTSTATVIIQDACPDMAVLGTNYAEIITNEAASVAKGTDFGGWLTTESHVHTFTITNSGNYALYLTNGTAVQITGHTTSFTVNSQPSTNIAPSNTTTFQITFLPGSAGTRTGLVTIVNNDPDENPYKFSITGVGLVPEIALMGLGVVITNGDNSATNTDDTAFGDVAVSSTHDHTFTITNLGSGTLYLTGTPSVTVSGTGFSVLTQPSPTNVAASSSVTFVVRFAPSVLGGVTGTVTILNTDSDESTHTFAVSAVAIVNTAPIVDNASGVTNVISGSTTGTAFLAGNLTADGGAPTTLWIYWGDNDGGTNKGSWDTNISLGVCSTGAFSRRVTGLSPDVSYYYRNYASNSGGLASWAPQTTLWTAQRRYRSQWHLACVPADYGVSNRLSQALGQALKTGLMTGTVDTASDSIWLWNAATTNWVSAWLSVDSGGTWKTGSPAVAASTQISTNNVFWVKRYTNGPAVDYTVFTGPVFTNSLPVTFGTANSGGTPFAWPWGWNKTHVNLGPGLTPTNQFGLASAGAKGGTGVTEASPDADEIRMWEGTYWRRLWLVNIGNTNYDWRWMDTRTHAFADTALKPGYGYYYIRRGTNSFSWTPAR